jgi:hypothetical protein
MSTILSTGVALAALGLLPSNDLASDEVDLVEVNHFYDQRGEYICDQLIFYDWSPAENRFQVRAYRPVNSEAQRPTRNWQSGGYDIYWIDADVTRHVHAKALRETWTQYDPERRERAHLPKDQRRGLYVPWKTAKP